MEWSHLIESFLCILGINILSALALASSTSLAFFCFESSGLYFFNNLNKTLAKIKTNLTAIFLKRSGELSDGSWHFQSCQEDSFLSLKGDVFRPLDESCEISGRLDVISESEVSWSFFEKGVNLLFDFLDGSLSFNSFTLKLSTHLTMIFKIGWL
jgi:hypothetical protein